MLRISAVSYLNTLPFIYGIENSGFLNSSEFKLSRDIPSVCAKKLENNEAEIVLVPTAAISKMPNINIISDYCIGANKNVLSVLLVSQNPLSELKNIYLDYQSRTSINLVKVLSKFYWKKDFIWLNSLTGYENKIKDNTGGVIIGDRALELSSNYKYKYDLAAEWNNYTGLPFVFACWASNSSTSMSKIKNDFIDKFNKSLKWGIEHINNIKPNYPNLSNEFIQDYYKFNIDYNFDNKKREGMKLFFKYLKEI